MRMSKRMRARRREKRQDMLRAIIATFAIILIAIGIYAGSFYRADTDAINGYAAASYVEEQTLLDGSIAFVPAGATAGVIFYPGGKVELNAYIPLMQAIAAKGIAAIAVKMPLNLAVLKISAADGIREQFPNIGSWYMAGHSLGGAMAANYVYDNPDEFDGLILLGAYSTANLSNKELKVLSVYGSADKILNADKYEKNKGNLPETVTEIVIDGANHSGYGMYGAQKGDGEATMSNAEQINMTADLIAEFIN